MLSAMPLLAEAFLSPGLGRSLSQPSSGSASSVCIAPQMPFFLGFPHCKTHLARFSHLHSFPSRYFLGLLSKTVSFQNT
jgi:hypothetical protein